MGPAPSDREPVARFHESARAAVREALDRLRVGPMLEGHAPPPMRRVVLVDRGDGALSWRDSASAGVVPELASGERPVVEVPIEVLAPNRIGERLARWDAALTPDCGLRRWSSLDGAFTPVPAVPPVGLAPDGTPGRILLVLHGTFSHGGAIFDQLARVEPAGGFLAWAGGRYEHVLAYDHPTLSVSPVLNALDLARLFAGVTAPVDVLCHSRGGLVARWWLEAFGGARVGPRRAVFVASPLGGTSLAAPPRVRDALDLFTTVGAYLRDAGAAASTFAPFLTIAVGLLQVFVSVTGSVAQSPLADLFFAAVPGLGAMSRVGNNPELARLHAGTPALPPYFAVSSDFQMERAGWRFWKLFDDPKRRAAQWGASRIFAQPNDLVVDNRATIELFRGAGIPPDRRFHLGSNGVVHHTNYFEQPRVLGAIREFLA